MSHHDGDPSAPAHAPIKIKLPAGVGRFGLSSRTLTVAGAGAVAVVMVTAAVALAASGGDKPAEATARSVAQDNSYRIPVGELLENGSLPRPALQGDQSDKGVPAGTAPRPTTPVSTPGTAGQIATYSGAAGTLTPAGIATLAIKAGCSASSAVIATAVAIAESGGSPAAQGDTTLMDATWDWSAGLWQIRGLKSQRGTGQLRDSVANHNPASNAAAMFAISSGCADWQPWTTYTRGTYRAFLEVARRAVAYVERYRRSHDGALPPVAAPDPDAPVPAGGGANGAAGGTSGAVGTGGTSAAPGRGSSRSAAPVGGRPSRPSSGGSRATGAPSSGSSPSGTSAPTSRATQLPTRLPTLLPTKLPTLLPTKLPTKLPTLVPTKLPTLLPTKLPTLLPTKLPILG